MAGGRECSSRISCPYQLLLLLLACCACREADMLVGVSAIPPHPQITAVQESHWPPTGVAQRAVPEWKDRGGGVRR